jgi:hypothetical protein
MTRPELKALHRCVRRDQGVAVLAVDDIAGHPLCQAVTNRATRA